MLQTPTHEVCPGCEPGEEKVRNTDQVNAIFVSQATALEEMFTDNLNDLARKHGGLNARTEPMLRRIAAVNNDSVHEAETLVAQNLKRVVCPLAGQAACAGTCQAQKVPAFPELQ